MDAAQQYADFAAVQDRLVAVMKKTASIDEAAYSEAARALNFPSQQASLDDLAELYQASLKIRDFYFVQSSDSVLATVSRGVSMLGRYWGFADNTALSAVSGLSLAVGQHEANLKAVEDHTGLAGNLGTFVPGGDTVDPLEVGKEEQKDDLRKAIGSYVPWILAGLVALFLLRKYL
jgi:hypothetical protein